MTGTPTCIYGGSNSSASSIVTTLFVAPPSAGVLVAGDVIEVMAFWDGHPGTVTAPSGFSLVTLFDTNGGTSLNRWYKITNGTESSNFTASWTSGARCSMFCSVYRNVLTSSVVDVNLAADIVTSGSGDSVSAPSITASAGGLLVGFYGNQNGDAGTNSAPAGMTRQAYLVNGNASANGLVATMPLGAGEASGVKTATVQGTGTSDLLGSHAVFTGLPGGGWGVISL